MSRRVKEFVDVADHVSIDELIEKLTEMRDSLPDGCRRRAAAARRRNFRPPDHHHLLPRADRRRKRRSRSATPRPSREAKERELARLQAELGVVCYAAPGKRGKLRIVA